MCIYTYIIIYVYVYVYVCVCVSVYVYVYVSVYVYAYVYVCMYIYIYTHQGIGDSGLHLLHLWLVHASYDDVFPTLKRNWTRWRVLQLACF